MITGIFGYAISNSFHAAANTTDVRLREREEAARREREDREVDEWNAEQRAKNERAARWDVANAADSECDKEKARLNALVKVISGVCSVSGGSVTIESLDCRASVTFAGDPVHTKRISNCPATSIANSEGRAISFSSRGAVGHSIYITTKNGKLSTWSDRFPDGYPLGQRTPLTFFAE